MKHTLVSLASIVLFLGASFVLAGSAVAATSNGPDHTVIVIMENRFRYEVIGNSGAPYENALANQGVDYSNAQGVTHPSLGNYLALYSGGTQGQAGKDICVRLGADNVAKQAAAHGVSFKVYMENMGTGSPLTDHGTYACRHNPAAQFTDAANAVASTDFGNFPTDFTQLPQISFVVPNLCNDTHDCGVPVGDSWLKTHMDTYVQWAKTHNSILIVTWDENHSGSDYTTPMPTFVVGAGLTHSVQGGKINQYNMLRTIEDWYGLPRLGSSASASPMPGLPSFAPATTTPPASSTPPATSSTSSSTSTVPATSTSTRTSTVPTTSTASSTTTSAATTTTAATTTATTTAPPGPFAATFTPTAGINAWWVEVKVVSPSALTKVEAQSNGAGFQTLSKTSWGTWAKSFNVPKGSSVVFQATDASGATATAPAIPWMGPAATTTPPTSTTSSPTVASTSSTGTFSATFSPKWTTNNWWVETIVVPTSAIAKVEARDNGGAWTVLPKTAWGTYARSFYVADGHQVEFRATSATGETASSSAYTWG